MLPTEFSICEEYKVSRITVRRALEAMQGVGLISRRAGVGTMVMERPSCLRSNVLTSSLDAFLDYAGKIPSYLNPSKRRAVPPPDIAEALHLTTAKKVTVDEATVIIEGKRYAALQYFSPDEVGNLVSIADLGKHRHMISIITERLGGKFSHAFQVIEAVSAAPKVARQLGIKANQPILRVRRTYYLTDGRPIQVCVLQYHPQRYEFAVELRP
jgi:GntR family transcriptional regulator